ncbi:ABC transporter permease [Amycolatopsis sp. K13G38]|uniref:ABC transporter permease n=1 Tax=Amycolatopsis acididurans TaxID=2724524 RepID=A0ABX1IY42_9PSEU|nr:ABC transporter permease [Amycolatopsis acididurans]NKQ51669.1 ABC transporter permease [Amycolatopsis acididurans]
MPGNLVGTRAALGRALLGPVRRLDSLGRQAAFHSRVYALIPRAVLRYKREVVRLIAEVSLGTGGLAIIGGTVTVVVFMTAATGVEIGLQGYSSLSNIGVEALSGFVSSYANTREAAPVIAGIALVATVGAGFTAQLGAMRVSEEIDALEVMAVPSLPFLVTTRIIAGFVAVIPLYSLAVLGSYAATRVVVTVLFGQSGGTYDHYFSVFLVPSDLLWSFLKALVMSLVVMSVHCYHGFTAGGGPAGVGRSVGQAVRSALIGVMLVDLVLDLAIYGSVSSVHISG